MFSMFILCTPERVWKRTEDTLNISTCHYRSHVLDNPKKKYTVTEKEHPEKEDTTSINTQSSSDDQEEKDKGSPQYQV